MTTMPTPNSPNDWTSFLITSQRAAIKLHVLYYLVCCSCELPLLRQPQTILNQRTSIFWLYALCIFQRKQFVVKMFSVLIVCRSSLLGMKWAKYGKQHLLFCALDCKIQGNLKCLLASKSHLTVCWLGRDGDRFGERCHCLSIMLWPIRQGWLNEML